MTKKLMNEVLPAPVIAPRGSPRDRVLRHMRDALTAGAAVAMVAGIPFGCVDPLPPPAQCLSNGPGNTISVTVTRVEVDGGPAEYDVVLTQGGNGGFTYVHATATNATFVAVKLGHYRVTPAAGSTSFDLVVGTACDQTGKPPTRGLKISVALGPNGPTTTVVEVSVTDGG